ncbi:galactose-1-phosphate uridylyltransferase [Anaerobacillus alkalilacustris]|uniref:Galactose-1-phosphate uridylyltransferase n=1 Tax=Anaerobacillus alkalilacustris TaxID=393763 RepID=A0A1S2LWY7_9BACI|nr:UDP-glucose--hexose-1-phosphate uridylyltransferase [Anaerobacillus alkalilacustris]OIJ17039.1 galactose-1-phosphate uridylyltransferase [Anaerobacillus alkalilacustris]
MSVNIHLQIERLIQFAIENNLVSQWDKDYTRNSVLDILGLEEVVDVEIESENLESPIEILEEILDWAAVNGCLQENTVTYRDLLDTKIMGCFVPRPSEVIRTFEDKYRNSPEESTEYFYQLSKQSHYIRTDRIAKNEHWYSPTEYGDIEITINLSKPEKDPKAIAAAKHLKQSSYPKCLLCKENVGYVGRVNHPARQNLRTIPVTLMNELWYLQYSPYVYYHEHSILFSENHVPMKISKKTFSRLLEFVEQYPHYFLGSNADLPIVGGSILSHDHFQGGYHEFPMAKAEMQETFSFSKFPNVTAGIVKWPMSVIRLQSEDKDSVVQLADHILSFWKQYSDEDVDIYAFSEDTPHNTITPIARRRGELFELDLVLRNNRTNDEHPMGIFHPHTEVHHIKKENIGLIEVMGLAVLPGRLKEELQLLAKALLNEDYVNEIRGHEDISKHLDWANQIKAKYSNLNENNVQQIVKDEVGKIFSTILEHAGVFKRDEAGNEAFVKFIKKASEV